MSIFPNVPNVPGVPPLFRGVGGLPPAQQAPADIDTSSNFGVSNNPQWGIFKDGQAVVTAESVIRVEYRQEWSVSDYPLEQGAFESYNKVNTPFEGKVRFATGESEDARTSLLQSIAAIAGDLNLYDLVTPEQTYQSVNIIHYDYNRQSDRGVGLLQIDVGVLEVRVTATAQFTTVKSDAAASPVNDGTVQTTPSTQVQTDKMYNDVRRQEPTPQ